MESTVAALTRLLESWDRISGLAYKPQQAISSIAENIISLTRKLLVEHKALQEEHQELHRLYKEMEDDQQE